MNEEEQIEENIRIANSAYPQSLSGDEQKCISDAKGVLSVRLKAGCTGCGYCLPCPAGVNIPMCFSYYNDKHVFEDNSPRKSYLAMLGGMDGGAPGYASLCRECGKCEKHCPQGLPVQKLLKDVAREMEGIYFKPVAGLIRGYYKIRGVLKRK